MDAVWMVLGALSAAAGGAFGWTFTEYALHNWAGHKGKGRNRFSKDHLRHHSKGDWFAPSQDKAKLAAMVAGTMLPVAMLAMGWLLGAAFTTGFMACYIGYEVLHRRLHTHPPKGRFGRWARKNHFHHHFCDPQVNHGVTTPIWDRVFGTHVTPQIIPVPERLAMVWLLDPATGDVHKDYSHDYRLVTREERRQQARRKKISAALATA